MGQDKRTQKEFQNGKLTFICKNEAGTYFQITVDTKGNILSQEKTSKE